ncbi:hypothetical protein NBRC116587_19720 [Pseudoteredinibacter isoporae]
MKGQRIMQLVEIEKIHQQTKVMEKFMADVRKMGAAVMFPAMMKRGEELLQNQKEIDQLISDQ